MKQPAAKQTQSKVLIANRGEIACRIIKSCNEMGYDTILVCSEADKNGLAASLAGEIDVIGGSVAKESYLDIDKILASAKRHNVDLVHPGYGFLSENASFATAVVLNGLKWIGPSPETINLMGDKVRAREVAIDAGLPVLPASGPVGKLSSKELDRIGREIGFPLIVKASAGGGGIGMRLVESMDKLSAAVEVTSSMAKKAFGDGTIYLERYISSARHVEVQIFGYGDGNAVHLFERDCSLQRRHQKIIEESPAPILDPNLLEEMAQKAVSLAEHQNYSGAGTIEFILDTVTEEFFFLEMNTRIQVEHPVTELITGLDLVQMQIELANGTANILNQDDISRQGHAIESRIYAENPSKGFIPSPGQLIEFSFPGSDKHVRIDTGFRPGDKVTHFYDPMIAKVIVWGSTRDEAINRSISVLSSAQVTGLSTNIGFLGACFESNKFKSGDVSTNFVDVHKTNLLQATSKHLS